LRFHAERHEQDEPFQIGLDLPQSLANAPGCAGPQSCRRKMEIVVRHDRVDPRAPETGRTVEKTGANLHGREYGRDLEPVG
ncbi:MAG: hypothetical protein GVY06_07980, partial [Alphaproteobacteria bacterium]|nr:hypothetical protein [Alphaproteobacteria bacterium]